MNPRRGFWRERVLAPILAQLRQGVTPDAIALTLALGAALGVFPILGASTLLCGIAAAALRLNQPVIQLVNYLVYPAQVLLLIPFYRAGETLFGQAHLPLLSVPALITRFQAGPLQFVRDYGRVGLYGVAVWLLVAPLAAAAAYVLLRGPLRALARRAQSGESPAAL